MTTFGPDFKVSKTTGTHADVLLAVGLADLLSLEVEGEPVNILENEAEFVVHLPKALTEQDIGHIPPEPGYPFLKANQKVVVPGGAIDPVDYKAEKAKADRVKKMASTRGKQKTIDPEAQQLIQEEQPRSDWRLLQVLNTLQGDETTKQGDETTNKMHRTIISKSPAEFSEQLMAALASFGGQQSRRLDWEVSLVQLFTPLAAKGYSRHKPDSTGRNDKTKEQWAEPFSEWLRYRGYFRVACPFFQDQDVRLLCPIPKNISIRALSSLAGSLARRGVYGAAPKMDALAVLRLAELLIRQSQEYHDADIEALPNLNLGGKSPADLISGVTITHYQSLGNAKAISAMSTLSLPGWFPINSGEDAQEWLNILDEHQRVIRGLQDDHSDEIGLLLAYRRFLERRGETAAWALIEFMEHYGPFVMRANGSMVNNRRRWVSRFTDQYFRRVLMGTNQGLLEIIKEPGFEAVARAVRQATVTAQHKKAKEKAGGEKEWREVRYELLHDLHRTRKVPGNAFIECVAEFVSRYNYENARHREQTGDVRSAPANVSDEEFKAFVSLVDRFRAPTVGALLAAYGSCKEKWEGEDSEPDSGAAVSDNAT